MADPDRNLQIVVLFGSVRSERKGIRVARFVVQQLTARGHTVTLIDPIEYQLPLLDRMYKEYPPGEAPDVLRRLAAIYKTADAFVVVTAEYNHSLPPALKNLLDHFLEEYFWRPSAIVSYSAGAFGGVRAAVQLRIIVGELGMPSIPTLFAVPRVAQSLETSGTATDAALERRFTRFAAELEWYASALRSARAAGVPY
jgi:NAD(P)H-dependent FMN reductase